MGLVWIPTESSTLLPKSLSFSPPQDFNMGQGLSSVVSTIYSEAGILLSMFIKTTLQKTLLD
jgi:hypothetical protein